MDGKKNNHNWEEKFSDKHPILSVSLAFALGGLLLMGFNYAWKNYVAPKMTALNKTQASPTA